MNNNDYQRVKDALNIVDVVGEYVTLRKSGSNYLACCPFHGEKHASMSVSNVRGTYKCYACGAGGDVISFVQAIENLANPYEALELCAKKAGITLQTVDKTPEQAEKQRVIESMHIAIDAAASFFQGKLPQAASYLSRRGFSTDNSVITSFRVGYAPAGNELSKSLTSQGFTENKLIAVNVSAKSDRGYLFDVFRDRIMFPFLDIHGRVVGFTGRWINPQENTGKYVNTGDTLLFTKGKHLFGLYQARQSIARNEFAYITEGQFDVLSMHAAGCTNTIAGSGTAFQPEQAKLLHRYTTSAVLIYDGDKAGLSASIKTCRTLLAEGISVQCVSLPDGQDPDEFCRSASSDAKAWLINHTVDFVSYFSSALSPSPGANAQQDEEVIDDICSLIALVPSETLRLQHCRFLSNRYSLPAAAVERKVKSHLHQLPEPSDQMKPGIYGMDLLPSVLSPGTPLLATADFEEFMSGCGDQPIVYIHGIPPLSDVQILRKTSIQLTSFSSALRIDRSGTESSYLAAMALLFKSGISSITIIERGSEHNYEEDEEEPTDEEGYSYSSPQDESYSFIYFYSLLYKQFFRSFSPPDRSIYIDRCADLISYADDSVRIVNLAAFSKMLDVSQTAMKDILKPYLLKRKSRMAINAQRQDDEDEEYDPDEVPDYVENNPEYKEMYRRSGYYPKINKDGEPVCYMFRNSDKGGHTQVADFYMLPLLHIRSLIPEENKRVLRINRRYFKTPLYIEVPSKALTKLSSIDEYLCTLEAVNFSNGDERMWRKIKETMSYHYVTCDEVEVYGNQQTDGSNRDAKKMFFAFANGIAHEVDGVFRFEESNDLGVVVHEGNNFYLPAFSTIYAGSGHQEEKYEVISRLVYRDIPAEKQCSFRHWAELMNEVYSLNDNGKWAILYAVMCAFRSNIHGLDRFFTAPFFMGPMSSGKTQIAISIRSIFMSPNIPIFNLNTGSLPALSARLSTMRDVPEVLDEYNNKDIQDVMFQYLKQSIYDGDGRQKRKGSSGKDIEIEKIYSPVIICGQETPQRDDNALMSRIIVCEVSKPKEGRTDREIELFNELKTIEDPEKIGLSNVLLEILSLRPKLMTHFRTLKQECYNEIKPLLAGVGEIDRLMKTTSLFLATCKFIEKYSSLQLPFTYNEFLSIAVDKIKFQIELITKTDKLATFFKAMDVMIDTKAILPGRDFVIDTPDKITIKLQGGEKKPMAFPAGTRILFLRVSNVYTQYARGSFDREQSTQSTIEQNLRSHPSYIGAIQSRRFAWFDVAEVPRGGFVGDPLTGTPQQDHTMIKVMKRNEAVSSCIAINYEVFYDLYGIDLQRAVGKEPDVEKPPVEQELPF